MSALSASLEGFDVRSACAGILAAIREIPEAAGLDGHDVAAARAALSPSLPLSTLEQWACSSAPSTSQAQLLDALAELLVSPHLVPMCSFADALAHHARPLVVDVCARVLLRLQHRWQASSAEKGNQDVAIAPLYAFAWLLPLVSGLYPLVCDFLQLWSVCVPQGEEAVSDLHRPAVLVALYRITSAAPAIIDDAPLPLSSTQLRSTVMSSGVASERQNSSLVRLVALQVYALVEGLAEVTVTQLRKEYIGSAAYVTTEEEAKARRLSLVIVPADSTVATSVEEVDPWLLPVDEAVRRAEAGSGDASRQVDEAAAVPLEVEALSPLSTSFGAHVFYRNVAGPLPASDFKETPHSRKAIARVGELLSQSLPVLLSGPEASGKSSLIRHACRHFSALDARSPIVTLQLGDQSGIDAKSLIGSYISSTTKPGTFEWVEGALTRAVRLGKWLVLKDIDRASSEVLSVIKPLVEDMGASKSIGMRPSLQLGGSRGAVVAKRGFALFATRSIRNHRPGTAYPQPTFLGWKHWSEAQVDPLSTEDVYEIIAGKARLLAQAQDNTVDRLVTTWLNLIAVTKSRKAAAGHSGDLASAGSQRTPSLHDLLKWCRRIESLITRSDDGMRALAQAPFANQALHEEIALEACDLFLGGMVPTYGEEENEDEANKEKRQTRFELMLETVASSLDVEPSMLRHAMRDRKPEFRIQSSQGKGSRVICVGRAQALRSQVTLPGTNAPSKTFAMTGPASRLMERICVGVSQNEAMLIVGETGTGKTTVVQQLAALVNKPLIALNLSQQTETADLLGGFKPIDPKVPATDLHNTWVDLFQRTFSSRRNARYLQAERKMLQTGKWVKLHKLWSDSLDMASKRFEEGGRQLQSEADDEEPNAKARRLNLEGSKGASDSKPTENGHEAAVADDRLRNEWKALEERLDSFGVQFTQSKRNMVFSFVEGPLIQAIQTGAWVLLDEINLATSETLESLSALLQTPESSLTLSERGDLEPVPRHPDFRLFACMNPATDVGKKDLPDTLRSRFTELYAPSPDADQDALVTIVEKYIADEALGDRAAIMDAAHCFVSIKKLARNHRLADGANQRPHYSVRTLSRALIFAKDTCAAFGLRRALYEGFLMAFTMLLDAKSAGLVRGILGEFILSRARNASSIANAVSAKPAGGSYIQIGSFWLEAGPNVLDDAADYILTPSVQEKLVGLARAALTRRSPVLIQGPTSAGKTSAIEYLARRTGHTFIRINNHEHTDLQEYLGSYTTDPDTGRLVFAEGLLVKAARHGHWVVLDELNLAPTDVLEALNRLLDDNRELVIPETNEVIRPHPHFMLFATQNPPGLYAGRKVLSRAFRNRFLEIHFDDVPQAELQTILARRCRIAPSYADRIVRIFVELQRRRQSSRVFDTKQAFATLRDLFRWGLRQADSYEQLGVNGYMLIAERVRNPEDAKMVQQVIEDTLKIKIDTASLYDISDMDKMSFLLGKDLAVALQQSVGEFGIVWTSAMRRLVCLVACSLRYNEPVLLVGETGTGKTSVCQVLAKAFGRSLIAVNCHQNTDASDLLGGQRPLRDREALRIKARREGVALLQKHGVSFEENLSLDELESALGGITLTSDQDQQSVASIKGFISQASALFEWHDGPLVQAMREGNHFLLDEISLADDSVLERLNSVLEPERTLVLAERGALRAVESLQIRADPGFQFVATMNPGGDYGKKELSPALRNRFTEVWVPQVTEAQDLIDIIDAQWSHPALEEWSPAMVNFVNVFADALGGSSSSNNIGLRDLISWARFVDRMASPSRSDTLASPVPMHASLAFVHGAHMNFVDGLALHPLVSSKSQRQITSLRENIGKTIKDMAGLDSRGVSEWVTDNTDISDTDELFAVGGFAFARSRSVLDAFDPFDLTAPTPRINAMRVLRAMQVRDRAIMLEGSPGAGKTSLIVALARKCGCKLTRINLSDQTELSDLFGADLPVDGGKAGEFAWREAAFLKAMQEGSWVLLDEMNLASQSVLEGLNSCLDHRGQVYVPELDRSFNKHPDFRFFAAQNPQSQGGGRKGLPKSFLNRFTKVYVEELHDEDYLSIMRARYPDVTMPTLEQIVRFNRRLQYALDSGMLSSQGRPWEFNLRDLMRWLDLMHARLGADVGERLEDPLASFSSLYIQRFRTREDRQKIAQISREIFGRAPDIDAQPWPAITPAHLQIGPLLLRRHARSSHHALHSIAVGACWTHLNALQGLAEATRLSYPAILVGKHGVGKTHLIRKLAAVTGNTLLEIRLNSGTDATDLIGGFEQVDHAEDLRVVLRDLESWIRRDDTVVQSVQADREIRAIAQIMQNIQALDTAARTNPANCFDGIGYLIDAIRRELTAQIADVELVGLVDRLRSIQTDLAAGRLGTFGWKDGPFVRAMRRGEWILLDEANLCNSSVLDRLNSVLEPNGALLLSERGAVKSGTKTHEESIEHILPHPNFRVFFALDPKYGELSRAMRNRGLEIYLGDEAGLRVAVIPEMSSAKLPLASASWSALLPWITRQDRGNEAKQRAALHALNAEHLTVASTRPAFSVLTAAEAQHVLSVSMERKVTFGVLHDIDVTFLAQVGLDLDANDNFFGSDQKTGYSNFREALSLLSIAKQQAKRIEQSAVMNFRQAGNDLSILQKSLLVQQGREIAAFDTQDRWIAPLATGAVSFIGHVAITLMAASTDSSQALTLMTSLVDDHSYLLRHWLAEESNDASRVKVILEKMTRSVSRLRRLNLPGIGDALDTFAVILTDILESWRQGHGQAMVSMWKQFRKQYTGCNETFSQDILDLVEGNRRLATPLMVAVACDVCAALQHKTFIGAAEYAQLMEVAQRTRSNLSNINQRSAEPFKYCSRQDDVMLTSLQLALEQPDLGLGETATAAREDFALLAAVNDGFPATSIVALKSLQWIGDEHRALHKGRFDWVKLLGDDAFDGGAFHNFFSPILLQEALDCSSMGSLAPLEALTQTSESLKREHQLNALIAWTSRKRRARYCIDKIVMVMRLLLPDMVASLLQECEATFESSSPSSPLSGATENELIQALDSLSVEQLSSASLSRLRDGLRQCWAVIRDLKDSDDDDLLGNGANLFTLAWQMMNSYVPPVPLDPQIIENTSAEARQFTIERLESEVKVWTAFAQTVTGRGATMWIATLNDMIAQVQQTTPFREKQVVSVDRRADLARLRQFHNEMYSFASQVVPHSQMQQIARGRDEAHLRNISATIYSVQTRMATLYSDIRDLVEPFSASLSLMQISIEMLLQGIEHAGRSTRVAQMENVTAALVSHPSAVSSSLLHDLQMPLDHAPSTDFGALVGPCLLTKLQSIAFDIAHGAELGDKTHTLKALYGQLMYLWQRDEEQRQRQKQEEASLYRTHKLDIDVKDDAELEEREFASLFPTYGDVLEEESRSEHAGSSKSKAKFLDDAEVLEFCEVHTKLFRKARHDLKRSTTVSYRQSRSALVAKIVRSFGRKFSEGLDSASDAFRLQLLADSKALLQETAQNEATYDFYFDAAPSEAHKMLSVVARLMKKLDELIKAFPDQFVLLHIHQRCEAMLQLKLSSPLNRLLSSLEGLLDHTEDWQAFASSKTSLQAHRDEIVALIIEWRRTELNSWRTILQREAEREATKARDFFMTLLQSVLSTESDNEKALAGLVSLLDQFLRGAPLGQFQARLELVESMSRYTALSDRITSARTPISLVLHNVVCFFGQFGNAVAEAIANRRSDIERDIAQYVKLASWKDTNVHALKASAAKTHRKLHKSIRKLRALLAESSDAALANCKFERAQQAAALVIATSTDPTCLRLKDEQAASKQGWHNQCGMQTAAHLMNLRVTVQRLDELLKTSVLRIVGSDTVSAGLQDLTSQIVERSESLARETPAILTETNEKQVKSLETRKRKAWSELLKELRRIGMSLSTFDSITAESLSIAENALTLPALESGINDAAVQEADRLHFRLLASLPKLRSSLASQQRNADVDVTQLQRASGFTANLFTAASALRMRSQIVSQNLTWLRAIQFRLEQVAEDERGVSIPSHESAAKISNEEVLGGWLHLASALCEILDANTQADLPSLRSNKVDEHLTVLRRCHAQALAIVDAIRAFTSGLKITGIPCLVSSELTTLSGAAQCLQSTFDTLTQAAANQAVLRPICQPLSAWIARKQSLLLMPVTVEPPTSIRANEMASSFGSASDKTISGILVVMQSLQKLSGGGNEIGELGDRAVPLEIKHISQIQQAMRLEEISALIRDGISCLRETSSQDIKTAIVRQLPFLAAFSEALATLCSRMALCQARILELSVVLCDHVTSLATRGFCRPRQAEDGQTNDDKQGEGEELEGGVGLGEGEGAKDVTDTLQDDETMEELEGQKQDKGDEEGPQGEKNARETDNDMSGDASAVEKEGDEDNDDDNDEDEKQEPEEAVGEVDPLDFDAVDEKTWSDEKSNDTSQDEKDEAAKQKEGQDNSDGKQDGSITQQGEERADAGEDAGERDGDREHLASDDASADSRQDEGQQQEEPRSGDEENGEDDVDDANDESGALGRAIDETAQEGENLDLADDLNMDEEKGSAVSDDDDLDVEIESDIGEDAAFDEASQDDIEVDEQGVDVDAKAADEDGAEEIEEGDTSESQDPENNQSEDLEADDPDAPARQDPNEISETASRQENAADTDPSQAIDPSAAMESGDTDGDATAQQMGASEAASGRPNQGDSAGQRQDQDQSLPSDSVENQEPPRDIEARDGEQGAQNAGESQTTDAQRANQQHERSLGDALKQFRRDLEAIEESLSEDAEVGGQGPQADDDTITAVEHVSAEQDTDLQALGAATEDDARQGLHDGVLDEQMEDAAGDLSESHIREDAESPVEYDDLPNVDMMQEDVQHSDATKRYGSSHAANDNQDRATEGQDDASSLPDTDDDEDSDEAGTAEEDLPVTMQDLQNNDDEQERLEIAQKLWHLFSTITSEHAFSLSEQLRLILSPTKATKLSGDFRTGKRLNMRKMIPFVASDYVKDKIWLRRHLPHKREYQILLCIDDSKSMSESENRILAYKSLALVCNALDRLEVGQVGVMKFGRDIQLLKGFDGTGSDTIGDAEGAKIISNLGFDQRGTNVLHLMQHSLRTLVEARETHSQGSGDQQQLWQLQLIISDGICQDHDGLRALIQRAEEARIMVVFVIVDSLRQPKDDQKTASATAGKNTNKGSSILTMSSAEYKPDASGRMQLHMRRYLDSFPFDYFVVVQEIADLPEILSSTLRQWAQRIAET